MNAEKLVLAVKELLSLIDHVRCGLLEATDEEVTDGIAAVEAALKDVDT